MCGAVARMSSLVDQFAELFAGNMWAVGTNSGGCRRYPNANNPTMLPNADDWFKLQLEKHLAGTDPCGVYPLVHAETWTTAESSWYVKWGCVDWDQGYEESWADAHNTHQILKQFGITSWIERSRSKGWHLWVFCTDWVPAQTMRHALMAACRIVDAPTKEVNPKQVTLEDGQLGNYVRLPYPGAAVRDSYDHYYDEHEARARRPQTVFSQGHHDEMNEVSFAEQALEQRTTPQALTQLSAMYTPPPPPVALDVAAPQSIELPRRVTTKLDGVAWLLMNDGPLPDKTTGRIDRSAGLYRLGRMMRSSGAFTADEAWLIMCRADMLWGRYQSEGRPELLQRTLEKAWA